MYQVHNRCIIRATKQTLRQCLFSSMRRVSPVHGPKKTLHVVSCAKSFRFQLPGSEANWKYTVDCFFSCNWILAITHYRKLSKRWGFFGNRKKKMMHYHEWPLGKFETMFKKGTIVLFWIIVILTKHLRTPVGTLDPINRLRQVKVLQIYQLKLEYHEILSSGPWQTSSNKVMNWPIQFVHLGVMGELFHNSSIVVNP